MSVPAYAELHCLSDFSFGRGASSARELFERAKRCGYAALAITDECSLAGVVRAFEAARDTGIPLIVGTEIQLADGPKLVLMAENLAGYTTLCELITRGRRAAAKGTYRLTRADLDGGLPGTLALWLPSSTGAAQCACQCACRRAGRPDHPRDNASSAQTRSRLPPLLQSLQTNQYDCRRAGRPDRPRDNASSAQARSRLPPLLQSLQTNQYDCRRAGRPDHPRDNASSAQTRSRFPPLLQLLRTNQYDCRRAGRPDRPCDNASSAQTRSRLPPLLQLPRTDQCACRRAGRPDHPRDNASSGRAWSGLPALLQRSTCNWACEYECGEWLRGLFGERLWLGVELLHEDDDAARLDALTALADDLGLRMVACGDVHMHVRSRRALQDTLTAIRHRKTLIEARGTLYRNGERHLRRREALAAIYPAALLAETVRIARRCTFTLDELHYRYPAELVPDGHTPTTWLRHLTEDGIRWRWPDGEPVAVRAQIEHELALIAELQYEPYFLTVHDIVRFARSQGILCQGRGSAANSAVCFALGITAVDPARSNMLVERFISKERNEPPDIDIDFEHERREEVIQYIYRTYGRERAGLTATVICYRARSAVRDVAKALGLPLDAINKLSFACGHWDGATPMDERLVEAGFDPASPILRRVLRLTHELLGRPRHLSQHVGGFVISDAPLSTLVPVENAAMPERTIIQWDKDDLDALGLLKIDCLALGMLTCLHKTLDLLRRHRRRDLTLATIPAEDPATYAMLQRADSIGVFQIESRAQMSMLPRLKPTHFYDLVIEVAIMRPGPIQGDMIHPYLRRRNGEEPVTYPSDDIREVLERTLGVPLFQEQVMKLAVVAAGYTPGEADQLRRSMAAWKRHGNIELHRERITCGMLARGYSQAFATQLFEQLKGFGSYGFPESHAASFALLAYASAWLKRHEPAAFVCALLNSLPMGFYSESQLVQDARRHGIGVRAADVRSSDWDCTLEPDAKNAGRQPALRLGLRLVRGFKQEAAARITAARSTHPFDDLADLVERAQLDARDRKLLANAGALQALAGHRHRARWQAAGIEPQRPLFGFASPSEQAITLRPPSAREDTLADYAATGLTLGVHPLHQLRGQLRARRCRSSRELHATSHGTSVRAAGLVTLRQRPLTANGVTFVTLEDEDGMVNVMVREELGERQRRVLLQARLMGVDGRWESIDGVYHLIARHLHDYSELLGTLDNRSRDFH